MENNLETIIKSYVRSMAVDSQIMSRETFGPITRAIMPVLTMIDELEARAGEIDLPRLEAALGKPVVSSNQALAWDCLRQAGCDATVEGFGRLLSEVV